MLQQEVMIEKVRGLCQHRVRALLALFSDSFSRHFGE